jgi:hypothetical protein
VGAWVNDAKRMVEDAWNWQALLSNVTISIQPNVRTYDAGMNERARLIFKPTPESNTPMAYDITNSSRYQLIYKPYFYVLEQQQLVWPVPTTATPIEFSIRKSPIGGVAIDLVEYPTISRTWAFLFTYPQDDLVNNLDQMFVPSAPVVQIALDYALNERGEEVGEPGNTVSQKAQIHIANAIALDSLEQDDKTTWSPN